MSGFDPDAFVAGGGFDPDAFVAGAEPQPLAPGESQDQGPPTADGAQLAPSKEYERQRHRDLLKRISEQNMRSAKNATLGLGQGATVGFGDEMSGVVGAGAEKIARALGSDVADDKPFVELYRTNRDYARKQNERAKEQDPLLYGGGQVLGGVAGMALAPGSMAARGAAAVKEGAALGGLAGLGGSSADLTKGEVGGAAVDTGIGAGLGAAASWLIPKAADKVAAALKNPIAQAKEKLGLGMQLPQKAYEGVAEQVGKLGMAQKSSSAAADVSGPLASANVKALRAIRDNAEMGSELASSLRAASEDLGGTGNKLVSAMTQEERAHVAKAMAELLHTRGLGDVTPEFVVQNMDSLARSAGLDLANLTGNNFLRMANKRDPQWWVSAGEGVRKFWGNKLLAGEQIDPRLAQQYGLNRDVAESMQSGAVDRMGRPMGEGGKPGVYQNSVADIEGKLSGQNAMDRIRARATERSAQNQSTTNPLGIPGSQTNMQKQIPGYMSDVRDHRIAQGFNPDVQGQTLDEMFPTLGPAAQSREAVAAALKRLQNIATGRNFLEQQALPLAGAIAGGSSGSAGLGMLGMLSGAPLGAGAASRLPRVADALGEVGQGLAQGGRDAIKQSALRAAGDPKKIQSLAQVPGAVGDAARRALEVAKDPAAFAARSYMLSMMPEFRQMLAGDGDAGASP